MSNSNSAETKAVDLYKLVEFNTSSIVLLTLSQKRIVSNITGGKNNSFNVAAFSKDSRNRTVYITNSKLNGRLGNKMFQYASLIGIAQAQGRKMLLQTDSELQKTFKLHRIGEFEGSDKWQVIRQKTLGFDKQMMHLPYQNVSIMGELQSFKYFKDAVDEVRQEFTFEDTIANAAATILDDVHAKNRGSLVIGVHVRRGDFLLLQKEGYRVPEKSYFINAFNWLKLTFAGRNMTFLVASDDLDWCRANLIGDGVVAMPPASPEVHLAVLTTCDHVIISGGTFGYWGAWLAAGYVIYYTGYMASNTPLGKWFRPIDYYPPHWIGLGN